MERQNDIKKAAEAIMLLRPHTKKQSDSLPLKRRILVKKRMDELTFQRTIERIENGEWEESFLNPTLSS
ncbi:TPA: hypothetical protein ACX6R4_000776 [Photobacterium damselae]